VEKDDPDAVLRLGGLRCCDCSGSEPDNSLLFALRFFELAFALDLVVTKAAVSLSGLLATLALLVIFFFCKRVDLLVPRPGLELVASEAAASFGWTFSSKNLDEDAAVVELARRYVILLRLMSPSPVLFLLLLSKRDVGSSFAPSIALEAMSLVLLSASGSKTNAFDSVALGVMKSAEDGVFLAASLLAALGGAALGGRGRLGLFFLGLEICSNSSFKSSPLLFFDLLSNLAWAL